MTRMMLDLRSAARAILKRPLPWLLALASLALGIGINTAVWSLYEQALLRPLPVAQPERLVNLSAPGLKEGSTTNNVAGPRDDILSYPMLRDLQAAPAIGRELVGIAGHRYFTANLALAGEASTNGRAMLVTGNYFSLLGLGPALGRLLLPSDDEAEGRRVAVLAHAWWQQALGADPGIVGRSVRVNGQTLEVVGVAPPGFGGTTLGGQPQVYVPMALRWELDPAAQDDREDRRSYWAYAFGRLAEGASLEQAQTALNASYRGLLADVELPLQQGMDAASQERFLARELLLTPGARGQSSLGRTAAPALLLLQGAAALVLLITCLNIANLLLAQGAARAGEYALRASIGASRQRLARQALVEAGLLAGAGALLSLPVASLALHALVAWLPGAGSMGLLPEAGRSSFALTLALAVATTLAFGLFPALQSMAVAPLDALRGEGPRATGSRAAERFRAVLTLGQVAFSMMALVLAGLHAQSLLNLARVDLGMRSQGVVGFAVSPGLSGMGADARMQLFATLEQELAGLPGVRAVSASTVPLLTGSTWGTTIAVRDGATLQGRDSPFYNLVGPEFFRTLGIALRQGRAFTVDDREGAPRVAIVNERFVEAFELGPNPVGRRLTDSPNLPDIEIVGVVADSAYNTVRGPMPPLFYLPWRQNPGLRDMHVYLRTDDPAGLLAAIPPRLARLAPDLPVQQLQTLDRTIEDLHDNERFVTALAAVLAVLGTALSALGLYGMLGYTLALRQREIGLRRALGAAPRQLVAMVASRVGRLLLAGMLFGAAGAIALAHIGRALLFEVDGRDPVTLLAAMGVIVLAAGLACLVPTRKALAISPMEALRCA